MKKSAQNNLHKLRRAGRQASQKLKIAKGEGNMKKFKAILALVLVAALMLTLFAACGQSEEPSSTPGTDTPGTDTPGTDTPGNTDGEIDYGEEDEQEITEIYVSYLDVLGVYENKERIVAAMNEISEAEIGVRANIEYWDMGTYATQATLTLGGGGRLDVVNVIPMLNLTNLIANGYLMDGREYYEQYCQEALEGLGRFAYAYDLDGHMWGLPNNRILANSPWFLMRKDILEACGQVEAAEQADSWSDLEAVLAAVQDYCDEQGISLIGGGQRHVLSFSALYSGDAFDSGRPLDRLGDPTNLISVEDDVVFSIYEHPDTITMMERVNGWEENGWIWPDVTLTDDHGDNIMKQGVVFSYYNTGEADCVAQKEESTGYEMVGVKVAPGMITATALNNFGIAISATCEEPEAAAKWINLLYTNADMSTLLSWGEEGTDWVMLETGEAAYPESGPSGYHEPDYMMGNQFLVPPWEGNGGDFREVAQADNDSAVVTPYLGMLINTEGLDTMIASLSAVYTEYQSRFQSGQYSEALLEEYKDAAYAVGMQEYLDEVQTQLDAWLAQQ